MRRCTYSKFVYFVRMVEHSYHWQAMLHVYFHFVVRINCAVTLGTAILKMRSLFVCFYCFL